MAGTRWLLALAGCLTLVAGLALRGGGPDASEIPSAPTPEPAAGTTRSSATPSRPTLQGTAPSPAPADTAEDRVRWLGRVLYFDTRAPVPDAVVTLDAGDSVLGRTRSGADGRFALEVPTPDGATPRHAVPVLTILARDAARLFAAPPRGAPCTGGDLGDLLLEPAWTIRGALRGEDGEDVPGASIRFLAGQPSDDAPRATETWVQVGRDREIRVDATGHFVIDRAPPRPFRLRAVAPGFVTSYVQGRVNGDDTWIEVRLRRGQSVRVHVTDAEDRPVVGARVNLYPGYRVTFAGHYKTQYSLDRSTATDATGRCVLGGLDDRGYRVTAEAEGLGAADGYVRAGWPTVHLELRPDWTSSRYAYENGPGGSVLPPFLMDRFAWERAAATSPEPPPPPPPPSSPAGDGPTGSDPAAPRPPERPPPPDRGRVHVRTLSADGLALPDVYVRLEGPDTDSLITDEDGTERLSLPPGRYDYRASPVHYGTPAGDVQGTIDVPGGAIRELEIEMPRVFSVRVEVRDAEERPMADVRVEVRRGDEDRWTRTGPDGTKVLFAETGEHLALLAVPQGLPTAFQSQIAVPSPQPVVLRIPARGEIGGQVVDPSGAPVFGARVIAERVDLEGLGEETWGASTDDRGRFVLRGPTAARYRVGVRHDAYATVVQEIDARRDATPVTLRLRPLVRLRGRVVDADGAAVARAFVEDADDRGGWVGTDEEGRFVLGVPYETDAVDLHVRHEDFVPATVRGAALEDTEAVVRLSRGVRLVLRLRGMRGRDYHLDFENAETGAHLRCGRGDSRMEDEDTVWTCRRAPAGAVRVRVDPREGEPRTVTYAAREGESVEIEATFVGPDEAEPGR